MKKPVIALLLILAALYGFGPRQMKQYKLKTIVIDPGHGGTDPGCLGAHSKEAHVTLGVSLEIKKLMQEQMPDVQVILTRETDKFVSLNDRASLANNNKADLFISIHCNSATTYAYGSETYVMGQHKSADHLDVAKRENSVVLNEENYKSLYGYDPNSPMSHIIFANFQNAFLVNSSKFADRLENRFKTDLGRFSRGVKQAGFLVLWKTTMPAVLCELGYLTNANDEKFLMYKVNQVKVAECFVKAIKEYKAEVEPKE